MTTLLAFAFAFYLLLPNHAAFEHPATSFLKVVLKGNSKSSVPVKVYIMSHFRFWR